MAAFVAAALVGVAATRLRSDWDVYPRQRLVVSGLVFGVGLAISLLLLLRSLGRPRARAGVQAAMVAFGLSIPLVLALLPGPHAAHPASAGHGADLWPRALACFAYGTGLALPFLGTLWAVARSDRVASFGLSLAAAAAGLVANAALLVHCPIVHLDHLLLGHASIGVVLVLGGAVGLAAHAAGRHLRRGSRH
jgi:hypothetical protein